MTQTSMQYTKLGHTEIMASKICVGAMSFGQPGTMHDWTLDYPASERVIGHALSLGINFLTRPMAIRLELVKRIWVGHSRRNELLGIK